MVRATLYLLAGQFIRLEEIWILITVISVGIPFLKRILLLFPKSQRENLELISIGVFLHLSSAPCLLMLKEDYLLVETCSLVVAQLYRFFILLNMNIYGQNNFLNYVNDRFENNAVKWIYLLFYLLEMYTLSVDTLKGIKIENSVPFIQITIILLIICGLLCFTNLSTSIVNCIIFTCYFVINIKSCMLHNVKIPELLLDTITGTDFAVRIMTPFTICHRHIASMYPNRQYAILKTKKRFTKALFVCGILDAWSVYFLYQHLSLQVYARDQFVRFVEISTCYCILQRVCVQWVRIVIFVDTLVDHFLPKKIWEHFDLGTDYFYKGIYLLLTFLIILSPFITYDGFYSEDLTKSRLNVWENILTGFGLFVIPFNLTLIFRESDIVHALATTLIQLFFVLVLWPIRSYLQKEYSRYLLTDVVAAVSMIFFFTIVLASPSKRINKKLAHFGISLKNKNN